MAIIDQRILIPARQDVVWAYISDLFNNCQWQVDCHAVSFLSTKHTGPGTRWRSTTDKGRDVVLEITSWYNGLGYEYTYVDGGPFKESKGRLRLQEIPEGTVVQWTFTFEGGGLLGGRGARAVDGAMAASLKTLYKHVKALSRVEHDELLAKSLMREAPDVEARAAYKPRHPSSLSDGVAAEVEEDAVLLPARSEPPVKTQDAGLVAAIDFTFEPPVEAGDTKPREPVEAPVGDSRFAPKPAEPEIVPEPAPVEAAAPPAPVEAAPEPVSVLPETPRLSPDVDRTAAAVAAASAAAVLPPPDTEGISIWERFGVPRPAVLEPAPAPAVPESPKSDPRLAAVIPAVPSEPATDAEPQAVAEPAAGMQPVSVEPPPAAPVAEAAPPAAALPKEAVEVSAPAIPAVAAPQPQSPRAGLRLVRRRTAVPLRRPE